jgi:hypothetical protein
MGGWVDGWMGGWVDDMYKMTVGQGVVYAYEAYEAKQRVALVRVPFYFRNFGLIPDRQSFCTYLYYFPCMYASRGLAGDNVSRERVLFIGTQFSILYTSMTSKSK